ncbi:MAG TPA: flagellar hook-basal body complex protein FliE [Oculatellaceae cyanobacterium]|jgi:flagellar hook-basal body complex protein FliE
MNSGYIPTLSAISGAESPFKLNGIAKHTALQMGEETQGPTFKDALGSLVKNVNETLNAPDNLMRAAMTTGSVDVHDVMIANAKAELVVNVTAQVATKVVQAYDRILQIQI